MDSVNNSQSNSFYIDFASPLRNSRAAPLSDPTATPYQINDETFAGLTPDTVSPVPSRDEENVNVHPLIVGLKVAHNVDPEDEFAEYRPAIACVLAHFNQRMRVRPDLVSAAEEVEASEQAEEDVSERRVSKKSHKSRKSSSAGKRRQLAEIDRRLSYDGSASIPQSASRDEADTCEVIDIDAASNTDESNVRDSRPAVSRSTSSAPSESAANEAQRAKKTRQSAVADPKVAQVQEPVTEDNQPATSKRARGRPRKATNAEVSLSAGNELNSTGCASQVTGLPSAEKAPGRPRKSAPTELTVSVAEADVSQSRGEPSGDASAKNTQRRTRNSATPAATTSGTEKGGSNESRGDASSKKPGRPRKVASSTSAAVDEVAGSGSEALAQDTSVVELEVVVESSKKARGRPRKPPAFDDVEPSGTPGTAATEKLPGRTRRSMEAGVVEPIAVATASVASESCVSKSLDTPETALTKKRAGRTRGAVIIVEIPASSVSDVLQQQETQADVVEAQEVPIAKKPVGRPRKETKLSSSQPAVVSDTGRSGRAAAVETQARGRPRRTETAAVPKTTSLETVDAPARPRRGAKPAEAAIVTSNGSSSKRNRSANAESSSAEEAEAPVAKKARGRPPKAAVPDPDTSGKPRQAAIESRGSRVKPNEATKKPVGRSAVEAEPERPRKAPGRPRKPVESSTVTTAVPLVKLRATRNVASGGRNEVLKENVDRESLSQNRRQRNARLNNAPGTARNSSSRAVASGAASLTETSLVRASKIRKLQK